MLSIFLFSLELLVFGLEVNSNESIVVQDKWLGAKFAQNRVNKYADGFSDHEK